MQKTIQLYRTISWGEFAVLMQNGKVEGQYNKVHKYSTYKPEYGNVVCAYIERRSFSIIRGDDLLICITIPAERVIAEGVGTYEEYDPFDRYYQKIVLKEVYILFYTIEEVSIQQYVSCEESAPLVGKIRKNVGNHITKSDIPHVTILKDFSDEDNTLYQYDNKGVDVLEYKDVYDCDPPEFAKNNLLTRISV